MFPPRLTSVSKQFFSILIVSALALANVFVAYAQPMFHSSSPFYHWHITGRTASHSVDIRFYNQLCSGSQVCSDWQTGLTRANADGYNQVKMLKNVAGAHASQSWHVYATTTIGGCGGFYPNSSSNHLYDGHIAVSTNNSCGGVDYKQGVLCQEIGHAWGFDHSATGDCMALGYYNPHSIYYSLHTSPDFTGKYYNH